MVPCYTVLSSSRPERDGTEAHALNQFKKLLLYAGLEREEYEMLLPVAIEENRKNLRIYAAISLGMFLVLILGNAVMRGFALPNMPIYVGMAVLSALILFGSMKLAYGHRRLTMILAYAFICALYTFSLHITLLHPDKPSVTTIVLLLVIPFLLLDRPLHLAALTAAVVAALCVLTIHFKDAETASTDCWNAISFGMVGVAAEVFQMRTHFRVLSQNRKIKYLSETDTLTGAKNRNRYEYRLTHYPRYCRKNLACVYIDVNGLHELNNAEGHKAGDEMLQTVAKLLIERFDADHVYRIGGDEFVCFRTDAPESETVRDMEEIAEALKQQGYFISTGIAAADSEELDIGALVIEAEKRMYAAKRAFYQSTGRDRRGR